MIQYFAEGLIWLGLYAVGIGMIEGARLWIV